jgi:hypothetical protein
MRGGRRKNTTVMTSANTVTDHLHTYLRRLRRHNDPDEGRQFTIKEVLNGPFSYYDDIELVLQVYGDYVVDSVKALFPPRHHCSNQLQSFVRPFTESANSEERCFLYFTTMLLINDISYEVVVEKQEVVDGIIGGRTRKEFNRKTRQQIVAVATKLLNIGNDDNDRLIAVPLPAGAD